MYKSSLLIKAFTVPPPKVIEVVPPTAVHVPINVPSLLTKILFKCVPELALVPSTARAEVVAAAYPLT